MSANINKILVIGGTSGIGEAPLRRFHARGKKVIATGRRSDRLSGLVASLAGIDTITWDITDLTSIAYKVQQILKDNPHLDTVFINAGIFRQPNLLDYNSTSDEQLITQITTNFTSVVLLTRAFMPHLVARAAAQSHAALIVTSSGLAFSPAPIAVVYCATKAAVHSFLVSVRQRVAKHTASSVHIYLSVCELIPPFVDTELLGKKVSGSPVMPMPLDEYMDNAMGKLDVAEDYGKLKREVATGSAEMRLNAWRCAIGPILEKFEFQE